MKHTLHKYCMFQYLGNSRYQKNRCAAYYFKHKHCIKYFKVTSKKNEFTKHDQIWGMLYRHGFVFLFKYFTSRGMFIKSVWKKIWFFI